MTNDLISREAALNLARSFTMHEGEDVLGRQVDMVGADDIKGLPAVDAAPVVHASYGFVGPHIGSLYASHGTCGNCKERILIDPRHNKFCPNCGAKMDEEAK